ncbi:MAG: hypothetical protein V4501_02420 [Pseudomonadota bacterium]
MLRFSLLVTLLCAVVNCYAYAPTDQSAVTVKLDEHWHPIGKTDDGNTALAAYVSTAPGANNQTILQTSSKKSPSKSAEEQVQQLYDDMKMNLTKKGCEVADLKPLGVSDVFKEWSTSFSCKIPELSGSLLIVDADPTHIYTFAFNVNNTTYTPDQHNVAVALLKQNMQLCYNGKNCYFL